MIMLKVNQLTKQFGGVKGVDDCSLSIEAGRITALVGPNGSGKSTLLDLVSGSILSESGEISLDGIPITRLSVEQRSELGISRLFQQCRLFPQLTARENLLLAADGKATQFWGNVLGWHAPTAALEEQVLAALRTVGLERVAGKLAGDLSYGQQRLVELAKAMLKPHRLLLLDEPVAGVSPRIRKQVASLLRQLRQQGETVLMVEHDLAFVGSVADRVVVMDRGRVVNEGTPQEVISNR